MSSRATTPSPPRVVRSIRLVRIARRVDRPLAPLPLLFQQSVGEALHPFLAQIVLARRRADDVEDALRNRLHVEEAQGRLLQKCDEVGEFALARQRLDVVEEARARWQR